MAFGHTGHVRFTRAEAIEIINGMFDPDYMDESDRVDAEAMTNEQLTAELCLSGYIHDEDMDGVY